ncbi:Neurofibromin 1, partial [Cladochytrium tenue]
AVIELCPWRLWDVVADLAAVLEDISNPQKLSQNPKLRMEAAISNELVHSQLLVLRILANCMAYYWKLFRESRDPNAVEQQQPSTVLPSHGDVRPGNSPPVARADSDSTSLTGTFVGTNSSSASAIRSLPDPPPLDEGLARFLLNALVPFFFTHTGQINPDTINHANYHTVLTSIGGTPTPSNSPTEDRDGEQIANFFMQSKHTDYLPNVEMFGHPPGGEIFAEMQRVAGRIIFYVSASNWPLLFSRIRQRMHYLMSLSGMNDSDEIGMSDVTELRYLEWCNPNRNRLASVIGELNESFRSFSRRVQYLAAIAFRKAIWNWIETHPAEFVATCQSQKRIDCSPELFLTLNSMSEGLTQTRRRVVFWPAQTMLLVLCPDLLPQIFNGGSKISLWSGIVTKGQTFLDSVRKAMKSKLSEVATLCLVDLCRASTYVSKTDGGVLRAMTPSFESELKDKLISQLFRSGVTQVASMEDTGSLDPRIITVCLTVLMKLNSWTTLRTLVMGFFDGQSPASNSAILVKSCLDIVSENYPLPWNSGLDASLAAPLRALFMPAAPVDKKAKKPSAPTVDYTVGRNDVIVGILRIWCRSPVLAIAGILSCLQDPYHQIRVSAAEAIRVLLNPDFVASWDGTTPDWRQPQARPAESSMFIFWKTTSLIVSILCRQLLELRSDPGIDASVGYGLLVSLVKATLDVLCDVLSLRNAFLQRNPELAAVGSGHSDRTSATTTLEKTLLILLCSPDGEIISSAIKCIGLLVEETTIADGSGLSGPQMEIPTVATPSNPAAAAAAAVPGTVLRRNKPDVFADGAASPLSITQNIVVYRELSTLFSGGIIAGQKAIQKKIRKILGKTAQPSAGNIAAWEEIYRRWRNLCAPMLQPKKAPGIPDLIEDKGERQNYTGFLCAMGLISLHMPAQVDPNRNNSLSRGGGSQGANSTDPQAGKQVAETFISELVTLLTCDNIAIREYVKEYLGTELNTSLFHMLVSYCESISNNFLKSGSANHDRVILFVESFISVLKMIAERNVADFKDDELYSVSSSFDFDNLFATFVQYLDRLYSNVSFLPVILRIRMRICQLLEATGSRPEMFLIRQDLRFRNRMVTTLISWNSLTIISDYSDDIVNKNEKLIGDLDLAIMKALVKLLPGLPVQVTSQVTQQVANADDVNALTDGIDEAKGKLFKTYLDFFLKMLQRVKTQEAIETKKLDMLSLVNDGVAVANRARENLQNILQPLKDNTILALSNLLAANIEIGLKYSLSMGYHEDVKIRTAFMEVLTNLLETGAKEQFQGLGEEGQALHRLYEKLVDIIVGQDFSLALALAQAAEGDETAGLLVSVFGAKGQTRRFFTAVIEHMVNRTDHASALLRHSTMDNRLLAALSRICGHDYLVAALRPVFEELVSASPALTFEIDPVRLSDFDDASINLKNLKMLVKKLLDNIVGAQHHLPQELRDVCHQLSIGVGRRFPEAQVTSVGAFMFLRFICPAIVAPESFGTFSTIENKDVRRGLLLAAKVIQNLANNVLFGSKESFMVDLNDLLKRNIGRVHGFLRYVSNNEPSSSDRPVRPSPFPQDVSEHDLMRLHRAVAMNIDKMENIVLAGRPTEARKALFSSLSSLVTQLGPAPDANRLRLALITKEKRTQAQPTARLYHEFVFRMSNRPGIEKALEVIREQMIFYEHGVTKDGHAVIYMILRKIRPELIDMELLIFHILTVTTRASMGLFDIVIDATYYSTEHEWDMQWVRRLEELLPFNAFQNLGRTIFLNCNTTFKRMLAIGAKMMAEFEGLANNFFISSVDELYSFIPSQQVRLPKSSYLEKDVISVFSSVTRITAAREHVPAIIRVAPESVHFLSAQKQQLLGVEAILTDTCRYVDLIDAVPGTDKNEFVIKYNERQRLVYGAGTTSNSVVAVVFSSPDRDAIVRDVRSAKLQFNRTRPSDIITDERSLRPGDVPGTLLNMAMLNLGSADPALRQTSYKLMVALAKNFDFDVGNQLLGADGLCIPGNNQGFILSMSEHLAATEKSLTLEFLLECVLGFSRSSKEQKLFCLEYMSPWLANLADFADIRPVEPEHNGVQTITEGGAEALTQKLSSLLKLLVDVTIQEIELFHLIQSRVWAVLGGVDDLLPLIIELLVQSAVENGIGSQHTEVAANTLITLAQANAGQVSGKIIFRLIRCLEMDVMNIVEQPVWQEISVLIRFLLMISFNDLIDVRRYLPELCYVVVLTAGLGKSLIRSSVHAICVNMVHSLCTSSELDDTTLQTFKAILNQLSSNEITKLFGIAPYRAGLNSSGRGLAQSHSALIISADAIGGELSASILPTDLQLIVVEFGRLMSTGAGDQ